jgi:hypothetical protein
MVMTDWMKSVQAALKTIPKNTPNRLGAAMKKAKLTYKKKGSSSSSGPVMKKTFRRRKGKGKGSRKSKHHSRRRHRGGTMSKLNPANIDGTSGAALQLKATNAS